MPGGPYASQHLLPHLLLLTVHRPSIIPSQCSLPQLHNTHLEQHMVQRHQLLIRPLLRHLVRQARVSQTPGGVNERSPVELGQEAAKEVEVGLGGADDQLDFGEREREVVLVAVAWCERVSDRTLCARASQDKDEDGGCVDERARWGASSSWSPGNRAERTPVYSRAWHASMLCVMRRTIAISMRCRGVLTRERCCRACPIWPAQPPPSEI